MARYVILEFEDNEDANNFVASVKDNGGVFMNVKHPTLEGHFSTVRPSHDYNVVGLYMRPLKACECQLNRKMAGGFTEGLKFGIWVHPGCGKPAPIALEAWGHASGLGRNLLVDKEKEGSVWGFLRIDGSIPDFAKRQPFNIPGKGPGR